MSSEGSACLGCWELSESIQGLPGPCSVLFGSGSDVALMDRPRLPCKRYPVTYRIWSRKATVNVPGKPRGHGSYIKA